MPGLFYSGSFEQLGVQAVGVGAAFATVFILSLGTFWMIKQTIGLRVSPRKPKRPVCDISEHGMYGYPEQFIPQPEYSIGLYEPTRGRDAPAKLPVSAQPPVAEPATQT